MPWMPFTVEAPATSPALVRASRLVAYLAATLVVLIGSGALVGWAAHVSWLVEPVAGFALTRPNAAVMFILCGLSLGLSVAVSPSRRWAARVLAATCASLALVTLTQDLVGRDFGIDTLLFAVPAPRPAPPASLALLFAGVALLLLDARPKNGRVASAEILAVGTGTIGWLALGGFLYGGVQFYVWSRRAQAPGVAVNAAIAMIALAIGIVAARPESGAMAVVTSRHVGGRVARRMLPIAFAIPLLGYFAVLAQRAGFYQAPGAAVVEGVAGMVAAVAITVAVGSSLERADWQRRRVEQETREWKRFFDRATFGAVLGTPDTRLGCVNEAFARMHGYTVAELEGRPVSDVFPSDRHEELADKLRVAVARGSCRWESEHVRKDGSVFPVMIDLFVVRDDAGRDLYRAAYVQDITEDREAEAARSRLASLVQSSADAIVAFSSDGSVLDWNRGAERLYGYGASEMVGRSFRAVIPADRLAEHEGLRDRARTGETIVGFDTERQRKDGTRVPIVLTLSPVRDAVGRIVAFSTIERDVSAIKQLEREREEWAALIAHDLRQPAAAIRLGTEALARGELDPARQRAVERMRRASARLERMVQDLLDVSRIESRRLTVQPSAVDLGPVVAEVIQLLPEVANRCRTALAADAVSAMVDVDRFVQLLSNLLSNACKYGDPGTPIEVCSERAGPMIRISVTNEGPGIAAEEVAELFSRFARTRSARSSDEPGLGLGLYICRGIVEAHGGELWVQSVPGEKTHFRFTLPAAPPEERAAAGAAECVRPALCARLLGRAP